MSTVFTLPAPRSVRRAGQWRFGYRVSPAVPDSLQCEILSAARMQLTSITVSDSIGFPPVHDDLEAAGAVCLVGPLDMSPPTSLSEQIHVLARENVEGITLRPGTHDTTAREVEDALSTARTYGFTACIEIMCDSLSTMRPLLETVASLPRPDIPDEVRLLCPLTHERPHISEDDIAAWTQVLVSCGFPTEVITTEIIVSAVKWHISDDEQTPVEVKHGELATIIERRSVTGTVRLGDGSLRMGSRGFLYGYIDTESVASLVRTLRTGAVNRTGGMHISYDGTGVFPTSDGLARIHDAVTNP